MPCTRPSPRAPGARQGPGGTTTESEIPVSSVVAGSSGPREEDTTTADVTAVAMPTGEVLPLGIAQYSTATESEVEGSSGEAWSSWHRADNTTSAGDTTVAKAVGEARPPGTAKRSASTVCGGALLARSRRHDLRRRQLPCSRLEKLGLLKSQSAVP